MNLLSPKAAAELAKDVYRVQDEFLLKGFMGRPEFSKKEDNKQSLKAEIGSRLINKQDGFGICARGGKGYGNDIFLIFRGTVNGFDWTSNARVGIELSKTGLPVHVGFNHVFSSMLPQLREFLLAQQITGTIHCIGHSLGGAIATLVADWVKGHKPDNMVKLYTFGAPRVGLRFFARRLSVKLGTQNIHRVYHATDPVPMFPIYPFMHSPLPGTGHYIPSSESICSHDAHDMGKYVNSLRSCGWEKLQTRLPLYHAEHAIEEWLKSKIPAVGSSSKTWEWINAALIFVLKKMGVGLTFGLQSGFTGIVTLADKIAWILQKGVTVLKQGTLVLQLMTKIMQALGMKTAKTAEELTHALLRNVLLRLINRITDEAQRAIRQVFRN